MVVVINNYFSSFNNLKKNKFIRDVTIIAGGTAVAQFITMVFSPVITRLYGPDAFGILGIFIAVTAMALPISNLSYSGAIVLPASDRDAKALVSLSVLITLCFFFIAMLVMVFFQNQIASLVSFNAPSFYLLFVPPVILILSFEVILRNWLVRKKQFKHISGITIIRAAGTGAAKSGFGLFFANAPVLLILNSMGQLLNTILLWIASAPTLTRIRLGNSKINSVKISVFKKVAYNYRDFPLYCSPQDLIYSFSKNLPTLMLAAVFGPASAGFYALSMRVLTLPITLISHSIGTAFLPRIAEAANRGERLRPLIIKATGSLALLGLLPFGVVIALGPWLFSVVFGSEWIVAGEYARWLAIWLYFEFINVPSIQAIPILGLQGYKLAYEILSAAVYAGAIAYGAIILKNDIWTIALISIVGAILYLGLIFSVILLSITRIREEIYVPEKDTEDS